MGLHLQTAGTALYRLMTLLLLIPVCFISQAQAIAQPSVADQKITIVGDNMSIGAFFKSIRKQTGLRVQYDEVIFSETKKLSIRFVQQPVTEVLNQVLLNKGIIWRIQNNVILLKRQNISTNQTENVASDTLITSMIGTVTGKVTDASGKPLPGATVMVKGTQHGASTNAEGNFTLSDVKTNAIIVISSIGFESREISVKGKTILTQLAIDVNDLDEAVVVAYGTSTKRSNVGAVTVVKGEAIENLPNRSFDRSLQGMVPGLQVTTGSGLPGGNVSSIILRGIGTGTSAEFGSAVRNPLIVIDGVQVVQDLIQRQIDANSTPVANPLTQLNPNDIESITILKDASAIALYGTRASNGVILVTTKKGREGRMTANFRHQTDIATRFKGKVDVLSQVEYLALLSESYKNVDQVLWTDAAIRTDLSKKFPTTIDATGDTSFYLAEDWFKELFNNHATTVSNDLSFTGGSDKYIYYFNFGHITQNGVIKNTGFDRASLRYNFSAKPSSWLHFGMNSSLSYTKQNHTGYFSENVIRVPYIVSPLNPIRLTNNNYNLLFSYGPGSPFSKVSNPAASIDYNINRFISYNGLANAYVEASFLNHFIIKTDLGFNFSLTEEKQKVDPRLTSIADGIYSPGIGSIKEFDIRRATLVSTNSIRYNHIIRDQHSISILLGQEAQILNGKSLGGIGKGLSDPSYEDLSNAITRENFYGNRTKQTLLSTFAQVNYNYKSKYLSSLSARRDGASKFGENRRYGSYWSAGVGWVITEESFMKKSKSWLDYFKLRGSVGSSGNTAAIGLLTRFDVISLYPTYNGNPAAAPLRSPGNHNIQWEQTFNTDFGIEAKLFQERVEWALDLYRRKTSNVIYTIFLPGATGFVSMLDNIGDMRNTGAEFSISAEIIRTKKFKWGLSINWSTNKNKLIKSSESILSGGGSLINMVGENFNSFYLKRWAGVNPADGKPQWWDSTGKVSSDYSAAKNEIVGKPQPDGFGGITTNFTFGNIEISALFYYQYGFQVLDRTAYFLLNDGSDPYINQSRLSLDRWQKPGDVSSNPRRVLNNADGGNNASTRYLYDGDFIRLKNVSISYTLSRAIIDRLKLSNVKVFIQGYNLALWTKYKGLDPDNIGTLGAADFAYPQQKTFSFGLNVSF